MKNNLKRVADLTKRAQPLPIKMQHIYQYSKWDAIHEPFNVVENVLKDDEKEYKALTPTLDFTLNDGRMCFVASIAVAPGECGPKTIECFLSNNIDQWTPIKTFTATKANTLQTFVVPGENVAKYLRLRCVNNVRGGNLVGVRFVQIKGLPQEQTQAIR